VARAVTGKAEARRAGAREAAVRVVAARVAVTRAAAAKVVAGGVEGVTAAVHLEGAVVSEDSLLGALAGSLVVAAGGG